MPFTVAAEVTGLAARIPGAIRHFCTVSTDGVPWIQLERRGLQVDKMSRCQFRGTVTIDTIDVMRNMLSVLPRVIAVVLRSTLSVAGRTLGIDVECTGRP